MIRVLHVVGLMDRGGMETFIMNVYRNIDRSKIQFDFLVHSDIEAAYDQEIKEMGGKIYNIVPRKKSYIKNIQNLKEFFKKNDYLIVHQHLSSLTYIEPLKIARNFKVPIRIVHTHSTRQTGSSLHSYIHQINKNLIHRYATHYFACSEPAAQWGFPNSILKSKKYKIIKNGIDSEKFSYNPTIRNNIRKSLNIKNKDIVLGHIGRFHRVKNHEFIIDIFKDFNKLNNNSYLILIGKGTLEEDIKKKVKCLGLEHNVIFCGIKANVSDYIQVMDYFLFPSYFEGLGMVLIEAQTSGLKSITTNNKVPKEVNLTGLVNYKSLQESSSEWAESIMKDIQYTRKDQTSIIKDKHYDVKNVSEELMSFYQKSLELIN